MSDGLLLHVFFTMGSVLFPVVFYALTTYEPAHASVVRPRPYVTALWESSFEDTTAPEPPAQKA